MEREGEGAPPGCDTGWSEVVRKKKRHVPRGVGKLDVATIAWRISYKDTFLFYFTEFPETHGAKEMLKAFKHYGDAREVVIPPKRDVRGKRFGFVRFGDVVDARILALQLDTMIIGATKIHVNVPKFQREWNENPKQRPSMQHRAQKQGVEKRIVEMPHGQQKVEKQNVE